MQSSHGVRPGLRANNRLSVVLVLISKGFAGLFFMNNATKSSWQLVTPSGLALLPCILICIFLCKANFEKVCSCLYLLLFACIKEMCGMKVKSNSVQAI